MESNSHHIIKTSNKAAKNLFQSCDDHIQFMIFQYLDSLDRARSMQVCKYWNTLLHNPFLWRDIHYSCELKVKSQIQQIKWFLNKVKQYKPECVEIMDKERNWLTWQYHEILGHFGEDDWRIEQQQSIKTLKIYFEASHDMEADTLVHILVSVLPNLETLIVQSKFLTDYNTEMLAGLKDLQALEIRSDDGSFEGFGLKKLRPLRCLFLRPYQIGFQNLKDIVEKSGKKLEKLGFDCEQIEQEEVMTLLSYLQDHKLTKLQLFHCEKQGDEVMVSLSRFYSLNKLVFHKGQSVSPHGFHECFSKMDLSNLRDLNLAYCSQLDDESLVLLVNKAQMLTQIDLSWCDQITSKPVFELFNKVRSIRQCVFQGLKKVNDSAFPIIQDWVPCFDKTKFNEYRAGKLALSSPQDLFTKTINFSDVNGYYELLKLLDLSKCDQVSDELLWILKLMRPYLNIKNQYNDDVIISTNIQGGDIENVSLDDALDKIQIG